MDQKIATSVSWGEALREVELRLESAKKNRDGVSSAEAETLILCASHQASQSPSLSNEGCLVETRMDLYSNLAHPCPSEVVSLARAFTLKRLQGVPLQYITGEQIFLDHAYVVTPDVLIPRPETEVLVTEAVRILRKAFEEDRSSCGAKVSLAGCLGVEFGLGSGVISIELLSEFSGLVMLASELSLPAAEVAEKNARTILGAGSMRLQIVPVQSKNQVLEWVPQYLENKREILERIMGHAAVAQTHQKDTQDVQNQAQHDVWGQIDFIIANPPYLKAPEVQDRDCYLLSKQLEESTQAHPNGYEEVQSEVALTEPPSALFAPHDDLLYYYRQIELQARKLLRKGGAVFLEIPHERKDPLVELFQRSGLWEVQVMNDLTNRARVLVAFFV